MSSDKKVDIFMPIYIGDYAADTGDLSTEEHGAYLLILMALWRAREPLPVARLRHIAKASPARWAAIWAVIERFFVVDGEEVTQKRLTRELELALERKRRAEDRGRKGGLARAQSQEQAESKQGTSTAYGLDKPKPLPSPLSLPSPSPFEDSERISAETAPPSSTPVLVFPCDGPVGSWGLSVELVAEWAAVYPSLDIEAECRKALAWIKAKPQNRKTAKGMATFLLGWFNRTQNRGPGANAPPARDASQGHVRVSPTERKDYGKGAELFERKAAG